MRIFTLLVAVAAAAVAAPASAQKSAERTRSAAPKSATDTTGVYELRAVTDLPRPIEVAAFRRALASMYPPALRAEGRSGEVQARFIVEPDGKVSQVSIVRSTDSAFDAPTVEAVRTLRFSPAKVDGRPVRVWVIQPIQWMVADDAEVPAGARRP